MRPRVLLTLRAHPAHLWPVLSKPLHPSMGRLLLIKPERFFDEIVDGLLREGQYLRTEVIPEEIESLLDTAHCGLVGVIL